MAKKQVIVNEEMIRGIMAGDIPNYGKNIPEDAIITLDESERVIAKRTIRNLRLPRKVPPTKETKGRYRFVPQTVPHGWECPAKAAGLYRYRQLPVHTKVFIGCSPKSQHVEIH